MPIYEYSCKKCGGKLEKEWSRTGFQFKGSGWYVTDYAGKKTDASESKSESKTDSTEAKAAESKESKSKKSKKDAATTSGD